MAKAVKIVTQNRKQYYEDVFAEGLEEHWEQAPGKDVIIHALEHGLGSGSIPKTGKILEVGCGSGFFLHRLQTEIMPNDFVFYGVDFSETAISKAKKLYSEILFFCEDGANTHFAGEMFDVVISYGTYEHFRKPKDGIREMARILRRGGRFFCMMPTLGIDRTDREDEGWYEERQVKNSPIRQMQWNLKRSTWETYFQGTDLNFCAIERLKSFGALKPGVFFFGKKEEE